MARIDDEGSGPMTATIPEQVKRFLEKPNFAVLATQSQSGRIQATPIWFLLDDREILINTSAGRKKLRNMEANPRVTLTIVDRENPYQYVQIQGRVRQLDRENGPRDIDRLSQRYHGRPYQYGAGDNPKNRVTVHIVPDRVSANFTA
jgi:PPOX class probable F420-dependent enzyme